MTVEVFVIFDLMLLKLFIVFTLFTKRIKFCYKFFM